LQQVFGKLELSCLDSVVDLVFAPTPTWDYSIVVTALQARNVVMKVQGAPVNYSAAVAGARTKIPGTVNVRSGTGTFAGYSTGAVIQFGPNEYLDPSTYRAFISLRDDTPGVPGTDPSISPIGAIWVDTKISSGFTVRNSGWASGAGPQALENITPAGTIYGVSLVNLPIAPSTVTLIVTIAGIDYTLNDNGDGTFSGMTNPGVLASPAPNVNYSTGLLSFQTSAVPSAIKVQYRFGPWLFDWVAVQDQ
jgi:hypothetical protein